MKKLLLVLFVLSQALYWITGIADLWQLILIMVVQFSLFAGLYFVHKKDFGSIHWILVVGILSRVIVMGSEPILEDDHYRYLWDGRVQANGINPYEYPPNHEALDEIHTGYREKINYIYYRTIYPPLAQTLFYLNHLFFPDSLLGLKFFLILFDLGTALLIWKWLLKAQRPKAMFLLYFFNPLVLKEISNSAHLDAMAMFFLTLSIYSVRFSSSDSWKLWSRGWIALLLSASTKLFSLMFVPVFMALDKQKWKNLFVSVSLFLALYIPYVSAGKNLFGGLGAFSKYWTFNEGLFYFLSIIGNFIVKNLPIYEGSVFLKSAVLNHYPGRWLVVMIFGLVLLWRFKYWKRVEDVGREAVILLSTLFILSPVVNAWYILWILPFVVVEGVWPWLIFCFLVNGGYSWFHEKSWLGYWQVIQYTIFAGTWVLYFWIRSRSHITKQSE